MQTSIASILQAGALMAMNGTSVRAGITALLAGRNTTSASTADILTARSGYIVVAG